MLEEESENGVLRYFLRYFFSSSVLLLLLFSRYGSQIRIKAKENYKILFIYRWMLMLFIVIVPEKYI